MKKIRTMMRRIMALGVGLILISQNISAQTSLFTHSMGTNNYSEQLYHFTITPSGDPIAIFFNDDPANVDDSIMVTRLDFQNTNYSWVYSVRNFPGTSVPIFANFGDDIVFGNIIAAGKGVHLVHVKHDQATNDAVSYGQAVITFPGSYYLNPFIGTPVGIAYSPSHNYMLLAASLDTLSTTAALYLAAFNFQTMSLLTDTIIILIPNNSAGSGASIEGIDLISTGAQDVFLIGGLFNDFNTMAWETYLMRIEFDPVANTFAIDTPFDVRAYDYQISIHKIKTIGGTTYVLADSVGIGIVGIVDNGLQIGLSNGVRLHSLNASLYPYDIHQLSADTLIVVGIRTAVIGGNTERDIFAVAFDPATGTIHWAARYDHTQFDYMRGSALVGDQLIIGTRHLDNNNDYELMFFSIDARTGDINPCQAGITKFNLNIISSTGGFTQNFAAIDNYFAGATEQPVTIGLQPQQLDQWTTQYNDLSYQLTWNISTTQPTTCTSNDGSITFSASGSPTGVYVYRDDNNNIITSPLQNLTAGVYTLIVIDGNNCTADTTVVLNPANAPSVQAPTVQHVSCNGSADGSITATVNNCTNCSYEWQDANGNTISQGSGLTTGQTVSLSNLSAGTYYLILTEGNCVSYDTFVVNEPAPIVSGLTTQDASSCGASDGSAQVSPSGGTPPYVVNWYDTAMNLIGTGNTISNLAATTYIVVITDQNGCVLQDTFVINALNSPSVQSSSVQDVTCHGLSDGSISAVVNNCANCVYEWLDSNGNVISQGGPVSTGQTVSLSNLPAGTYILKLFDAGCISYDTFVVNQPAPIVSGLTTQDASSCGAADGSAQVSPSGGVPPYTVTWYDDNWNNIGSGNSISNLAPGLYIVTITDQNGCSWVDTFTIGAPNMPMITGTAVQHVSCYGASDGAVDITVNCPSGNCSYQWSGPAGFSANTEDITNVSAGTYVVTVTDNVSGCTYVDSFTITEPPMLTVSITQNNNQLTASASGGTPPYSYQWNTGDTDSVITATSGTYVVTVTDANGCTATDSITITSIEPVMATQCAIRQLSNAIELSCSESLAAIRLYDMSGRVLYSTEGQMTMVVVPMPAQKGLYILQAIGIDGSMNKWKIESR